MVQKEKNVVESVKDTVDGVLDAGHEPTTTAAKRIMCLLLLIMAFLMVVMAFGTVFGWFMDFTGLDHLWEWAVSFFSDPPVVSDIPTVE